SLIAHATGTRVEFVRGTELDVSGGSDAGGLIGYATGGQLHALSCNAVTRGDTRVGGLIGNTAGNVTIYHCRTEGIVEGTSMVGGLAGQLITALMTDCYSHAIVEGGSNAGGLIGYMGASASASRARLLRSFSTGPVSGSSAVGGLVGAVNAAGHNFEAYSYWDTEASGQTNSARGTGKSTPEMQQQATYAWYNFDTLWQIDEDVTYPAFRDLAAYSHPAIITLDMLDGSGTPEDPFLISSLDELNAVRLSLTNHYRLAADIDASPTVIWDGGQGWAPVGPDSGAGSFRGTLDGGGHIISNLTVNRPLADYIGLFGNLNAAAISHLRIENAHMHGNGLVAALSGYAYNQTSLENCSTDGTLLAYGGHVGGVLGWGSLVYLHRVSSEVHAIGTDNVGGLAGRISNASSTMYHSSARGALAGNTFVGGLVGYLQGGLLTDSYSRTDVRGTSQVGGLVGLSGYTISGGSTDAFIYRCYSDGLVEGTGAQVGGLLGHFVRGGVQNAFWDMDASGWTNSARGVGLTTPEMRQQASYPFFNFDTVWQIDEGADAPRFRDFSIYATPEPVTLDDLTGDGTPDSPYLIHNLDELAAMQQGLTNHYRLASDIDASSTVVWHGGKGWSPVGAGAGAISFRGTLDGAGHTISNLVVNRPRTSSAGLFGYMQSAAVSNLTLSSVHVCALDGVATLAGYAMSLTTLAHCRGTGTILANGSHAGGLAGWFSGTATHCHADVLLRGENNSAGLFGRVSAATSLVQQSFALGTVAGADYVGGLIGYLQGGVISNCYSRVAVSGVNQVGGLVGESGYTISGGSTDGIIRHSYSAGPVTGTGANVGGLLGRFVRGTVTNSYWDVDISGLTNSARGEGRTTAEMTYPRDQHTTYLDWDFVDVWSEDVGARNAGYPCLLRPGEFNLVYQAGPGGVLTGAILQVVMSGLDGTPVAAIPDAGAEFDQWSDGRTDNPRTDTQVTANLFVTAHFKSLSLVPINWYDTHGIERGEGETWADVDQRFDPDKEMTLRQQFIADLDPNDANSVFHVFAVDSGPPLVVHFEPGSTGRVYRLQFTANLSSGIWSDVPGAEPRMGVGGTDALSDTNQPPVATLYRLRVAMP
ncbi:MAG TPA: GLUG motif-containing protein, partial [Kiritimatiellia bacterium]|nr:GLUG motif-containing protein [Kiritimatiellia bacterium]